MDVAGAMVAGAAGRPGEAATSVSSQDVLRYMAPFERSPQGVLFISPDGRVFAANPAACRLLQRDEDEILASGRAGLADPADDRWRRAVALRAARGFFRERLRYVRGDGTTFTAHVSSSVFTHGGRPWSYVMFDDASEVDAAVERAARQQAHAAAVVQMLDSISDAYFAVDGAWRITFFNHHAEELLHARREDVTGRHVWDMFPTARGTVFQEQFERAVATGEATTFEAHYPGSGLQCEVRAYPLDGGGLGVYFLDVGDRYAAAAERERLLAAERAARQAAEAAHATAELARAELALRAGTDDLTGLLNRAGFADAVRLAAQGRPTGAVCLLFVDLDRFKLVNDTMGHAAGDLLLQAFADRLRALAGPDVFLARLGGDEFAIALVGEIARLGDHVAEHVLTATREPVHVHGTRLQMTASIGLATSSEQDLDLGRLLRDGDAALYRAKEQGRDRAAWFDDDLHAQVVEAVELEQLLRAALRTDALTARFQPAFDLRTGCTVDVEALARWTVPSRGPVSPATFVPIAEDAGLIHAVGERMLSVTMTHAMAWCAPAPVRTWVNVSPRQLADKGMAERIATGLAQTGLSPGRFGVEVTESCLGEGRQLTAELQAIHALGVAVAIDDFGTGYSSLARLPRMPVDLLKIDRSFLAGDAATPGDALLRGIIALGHSIGARVTAEGVETTEQLRRVIDAGCDSAAGFFLQRPVPAQDVLWATPHIRAHEHADARAVPRQDTITPGGAALHGNGTGTVS